MNRSVIAIDPGFSGAIAFLKADEKDATIVKMPRDLEDLMWTLSSACANHPDPSIYCEKVGTYVSGNSGPSAATFAEHVGTIKMALTFLETLYPKLKGNIHYVNPKDWMYPFIPKPPPANLPKLPKMQSHPNYGKVQATRKLINRQRKEQRKRDLRERAQELYPYIKVTLVNADALGILTYGVREERGKLL